MNSTWEVLYQYSPNPTDKATVVIRPASSGNVDSSSKGTVTKAIGFVLLAIALGGIVGPLIPAARLEAFYWTQAMTPVKPAEANPLPPSVPVIINPLVAPDGSTITPVNTLFSIIIPKIGVNAPVIADVDPTSPRTYDSALLAGVAQASTSFTPDQNGTTYLFSHSTNYDWFVKDLNAVFYLLKNLKVGDTVVLYYKEKQYTYRINQTKIVNPRDISYLVPVVGSKSIILETCWPPGTVSQRLLVFADLVQER